MSSFVQAIVNKKLRERLAELQAARRSAAPHRLFDYTPKPGGQAAFWELVKLGDAQRSVPLDIDYRAVFGRGGIGSGKSFAGAAFACSRAFYDSTSRGLISANDYPQLETSTLVALAEFCQIYRVPLAPSSESPDTTARLIANRRFCTIFDAPVLVVAASKFGGSTAKASQSGRGLQVRWAWLDEWAYADKVAWDTLNGRLGRGNGTLKGQAIITSSINRITPYNWCYELFDEPDRPKEYQGLYKSVGFLTSDNTSLDADYVESLAASYSAELQAIELRGEYVTSTEGLVFRHFVRQKHTDGGLGICPTLPVHLSFDFNRNPATCLVAQVRGTQIYVVREFCLFDSDTFAIAAEVRAYLDSLPKPCTAELPIYGDASGSAQTANSRQSNWAIITESLSGLKWIRKWGSINPSVTDSVHSTNNLFATGRLLISPNCKELIKDLEQVKWDDRGDIDKKADASRTHLGDCLRYLCHSLFPFTHQTWREGVAQWQRGGR